MSVFHENLLKGKVAFVTGGGSGIGIGQRMAERFAEHSASVVLAGRKQPRLDAAASAIRAAGGVGEAAALDVREYSAAAGNFPSPVTGMSAIGFKSVIDI